MGWKCTPQVTGLVRGEAKQGQKHRSNVKAIVAEAGKERVSNSDTLDRDRTYLNRYTGFSSGFECADYITKEADDYRQEVTGKGGTKHYRKLRSDAVIGYAIIYNPPEEVCCKWTDEEYTKFYEDSRAVMEQIQPDIFRKDTIVMSAEHMDEGTITDPTHLSRHVHDIGIPKDKKGNYCGNKIDAKLLVEINKNYPKMMREKGWDIEDLDCTDWDRCKTDEAYRNERKSKRKSGKSVNNYIADKMREQIQENESMSEIMCSAILDALEVTEEKDMLDALKVNSSKRCFYRRRKKKNFSIEKICWKLKEMHSNRSERIFRKKVIRICYAISLLTKKSVIEECRITSQNVRRLCRKSRIMPVHYRLCQKMSKKCWIMQAFKKVVGTIGHQQENIYRRYRIFGKVRLKHIEKYRIFLKMIRKQDMICIWEVKNIDVLPRANASERPLSPHYHSSSKIVSFISGKSSNSEIVMSRPTAILCNVFNLTFLLLPVTKS